MDNYKVTQGLTAHAQAAKSAYCSIVSATGMCMLKKSLKKPQRIRKIVLELIGSTGSTKLLREGDVSLPRDEFLTAWVNNHTKQQQQK